MGNAPFTRDEVILALDVLYFSESKNLSPNSDVIRDLSELLRRLPIYSAESRRQDFRTIPGVSRQITGFRASLKNAKNNPHIGRMFYSVAEEYRGRYDELHMIAQAIRRNEPFLDGLFGADTESEGFPEGILLGHLHRMIERRDGKGVPLDERCSICQLQPELLYQPCGSLLEQHLVVAPAELDGATHYNAADFITVCPNCHAALHRVRPWLDKSKKETLLHMI